MRTISLLLLLSSVIVPRCEAKRWIAQVTTTVNLREGPSTSFDIITTIPQDAFVFYNDEDILDDFVSVIYIDKDLAGYVSTRYLKKGGEVTVDESGQLQLVGTTDTYNPEINVTNSTNLTMTLKMNDKSYKFSPYSKQTIYVAPGSVTMTASAPGVIPYVGEDHVKSNYIYDWEFYITTMRR